jgi:hypothetical protein
MEARRRLLRLAAQVRARGFNTGEPSVLASVER